MESLYTPPPHKFSCKGCDHPQNVRCGKSNTMLVESVKTPPPYESMESLYTPPPHKFSCKPGETRVVEIGCWGYDKCENGNPVTHYCTGGKVFERDSMSCVVSGHTSCNLARDCSNKLMECTLIWRITVRLTTGVMVG